jgi:hypothetical protein
LNAKSPFFIVRDDGPASPASSGGVASPSVSSPGGGSSGMDVERLGGKRRRTVCEPDADAAHAAEEDEAGPRRGEEECGHEGEAMLGESPSRSSSKDEPILFTLAQVKSIVQSALEERETELVARYDAILAERLEEQFNMFTKFNQDYIHSTFAKRDECSYMS